jgi:hypothetical protein
MNPPFWGAFDKKRRKQKKFISFLAFRDSSNCRMDYSILHRS